MIPQPTLRNILVAVYFAAAAALLGSYAAGAIYNIGPDGVSYISIAQHYADGHWKEAVNAYWSPMISWLMTPLIAFGIKGEIAFRILAVLLALAILGVGQLAVNRYSKNRVLAFVIFQLATLPMLINAMQYNVITPDLLVVLWMLAFALLLARRGGQVQRSTKDLILLGVFCAVGFTIKSVLLPISVLCLCAWFLFLGKAPTNFTFVNRLKLLAVPAAVLFALASLWVIPLSAKYHHLTLGSSSRYSMSFVGPDAIGHPVINGLIAPPNSVAVTPWEDPTKHEYVAWSPTDSLDDFGYYVDYILTNNLKEVLSVTAQLSPFLLGALWAAVILLILGKVNPRHRTIVVAASLLSVVLILVYAASHISGGRRYLWPALVLSNLSIAVLLGSWQLYAPRLKHRSAVWIAALVFPALIIAVWYPDISRATANRSNASIESLAGKLKAKVEPRARFASNNFGISTAVSYHSNFSGYGTTQPGLSLNDPLVQAALKRNGIEYYLYFERPNQPVSLKGFNVISTTTLKFGDAPNGFPPGMYKAYLIKLK